MTGFSLRYVGGPTALIETGGVRLLTDPTFDGPGEYPVVGRALAKTEGPAVSAYHLGPVDAVLLSHDQHPDNLDAAGRVLLSTTPLTLSTRAARERLGDPVRALDPWQSASVGPLRVTALPARHGPEGTEHVTGPVLGFALDGEGLPRVYLSGDNASLEVVAQIAERLGPFDVAVLCAGAARTSLVAGNLTLSSADAARAARLLDARAVIPLHFEHWTHVTEGADALERAFAEAGLAERLRLPRPGETLTV